MPASKTEGLTQSEIEQREVAAKTHGVYAIKDRGQEAMNTPQRSRYAELQEQLQNQQGVKTAMVEHASRMMVMMEAAQSWVAKQVRMGVPLGDIALLRAMPAFWNSCNRALASLYGVLPDDERVLDIGESITRVMEEHNDNT